MPALLEGRGQLEPVTTSESDAHAVELKRELNPSWPRAAGEPEPTDL